MARALLSPGAFIPSAWRDYMRRYGKFRWALIFSVTLSVLQALSLVPVAWLIKLTFDRILEKSGNLALLFPCGAILLLVVVSSAFSLLARRHSLRITKLVVQDIRLELFAKSYEVAATFSVAEDRSSLHTAIVQDTERIDVCSNAIVVVCIPALLTSTIFIAALAAAAPMLLLATAAAVPLALVSNRILGRKLRGLVEKFRIAFKDFDENIFAALRRIELTRLRGAEQIEFARQTKFIADLRRTSGRMAWIATAYGAAQTSITSMASVVTLVAGGGAVSSGWMNVSDLAAYFFILSQLGSSLNALWNAAPQVLAGLVSLENIGRLQSAARRTPSDGTLRQAVRGSIEFRDVHFSYGGEPVLKGIYLKVAPGARIAIVGANGSGKTTLAYLLLGVYRPSNGGVFIDDVPLVDLAAADYRRQIGVALQDQMIFAGTVRENIAYGFPAASLAEVERAARCACADGFIRSLPDGYDTAIGQAGVALSGGQSQMLTLARALLGAPQILILDEPTNHLDEATEKTFCDNLDTLLFGPTIVIITHDIELAARMDDVYLLADGRLSALTGLGCGAAELRTMRERGNA